MSASTPLSPQLFISTCNAFLGNAQFETQMVSAVWTLGLCSGVQSSCWPGLPYLGRLFETCLPAWIKPCHQSTFICLPLVLSQAAADSSKARVLGARSQAALHSVWVRNRRLIPKSVPASLLVLSNPCDWFIFSFSLSLCSFPSGCHEKPQGCFWRHMPWFQSCIPLWQGRLPLSKTVV